MNKNINTVGKDGKVSFGAIAKPSEKAGFYAVEAGVQPRK